MTNEWKEFQDYISVPEYKAESKKDTSYLGRLLIDIFADFKGLERILTILARGYLFHNPDGLQKGGDPYERIDHAANALKAWCSIPDKTGRSDPPVDFRELNSIFPELVNSNGAGWFYRHEKNVMKFIRQNPALVKKDVLNKSEVISKSFTAKWKKKVRQFQVPIFTPNTKAVWSLRFDDIVASALEAGPLRMQDCILPEEIQTIVKNTDLGGVPQNIVEDVISFCLANRQEDTDWIILPVTNFNYYYGSTMFEKKYLNKIPERIIFRDKPKHGVSRIKLLIQGY